MDQGQIAEQGTHTELLALQGIYYNLCQLQSFS
jgi:ABC-type multidrug transport system fused ATPase/permease subunit